LNGRLLLPINHSAAWPAGLIVVGTLIRIPQLMHRLWADHPFRQTQTTYVALEYARHGINPLHTPLPVFGPNSDVPFEFPLVQAAAALLIRLGVAPDSAMRIIGLAGFQAAAILLAVLVFRWHGQLAAIVTVALFEFSPFGLGMGAAALIDFPAVALSLAMVVGLDAWFRTASRSGLLFGAMSAWLAFLVKTTTPPAWCVLVVVSAATSYLAARSWRRIVAGLLAGPIAGAALELAWTRYADAVKSRNPLTEWLTSARLGHYLFGTLNRRLDPHTYTTILARVGWEIAGPVCLGLVLAVFGIILAPTQVERVRRASWLATAAFAPLVFVNLYYYHHYYLIGIFPAIVAAVGIGLVAVAQRIPANNAVAAAAGTVLLVVFSYVPIVGSYRGTFADVRQWITALPEPYPPGERIRAATRPDDLIVVVGCDWNTTVLYYADRRGLMLRKPSLSSFTWKHENINDYHYIFSCNPKLNALNVTRYLPAGHVVIPTSVPGLWRIAVP
jgi:multisubunit Na+/H+ antiporter MnhF subunit